jgi:hypothetical protein
VGDQIAENLPSITDFQQPGLYSAELRGRLADYLENAVQIMSTSYERVNPYTSEKIRELSYYTDGELIFNNLLRDYIRQQDFVLPDIWLKVIEKNRFLIKPFKLDEDALSGR